MKSYRTLCLFKCPHRLKPARECSFHRISDDDDLYDPDRLRVQVSALIDNGASACVLERLTLWWPANRRLGVSGRRAWEGSLLAQKTAMPRYASLAKAEDTPVLQALLHDTRVVSVDLPHLYLYQIHGQNTSPQSQFDYFWNTSTWRCPEDRYDQTLLQLSQRFIPPRPPQQSPAIHANLHQPPMVSCMMVTRRGRLDLARAAIDCFIAQTYPNRELVIVTEHLDPPLADLLQRLQDNRIRVIQTADSAPTLGHLRNAAVDASRGQFVCQWDDDDLYHPQRLARQLAALRHASADACLLQRWTIWWPNLRRLAISTRRPWEGSLLAAKSTLPHYPPPRRRGHPRHPATP